MKMAEFIYSLETLISPIKPDVFYHNYWEQKALLISRNTPNYWDSLLSLEIVDNIISDLNLSYPEIRIANAKNERSPSEYTYDTGRINVPQLFDLFSKGSTIILDHMHFRIRSLADLCRALEFETSMPVQTNIYLTPPMSQGFSAHYDTHDVFILQITGSKHWRIYDRPVINPLDEQKFDHRKPEYGDVSLEFDLNAGDLIYIPRGQVHDATTNNDLSMHITLGVLSYTWSDLLKNIISKSCLSSPVFRPSLPIGFAKGQYDESQLKKTFSELISLVEKKTDIKAEIDSLARSFIETRRPLFHGQILQLEKLNNSMFSDRLIARTNTIYNIQENKGYFQINFHDTKITFPLNLLDIVKFVLTNKEFTINTIPGTIDIELKQVLINRLIREGLLVFTNP